MSEFTFKIKVGGKEEEIEIASLNAVLEVSNLFQEFSRKIIEVVEKATQKDARVLIRLKELENASAISPTEIKQLIEVFKFGENLSKKIHKVAIKSLKDFRKLEAEIEKEEKRFLKKLVSITPI